MTPSASFHTVLSDTPVGPLTLFASTAGLREVRFGNADPESGRRSTALPLSNSESPSGTSPTSAGSPPHSARSVPILETAADAVHAYLEGAEDAFGIVPLDLDHCTDFQRAVYRLLTQVPRGSLVTYGEIAQRLGRGAPRAVGQAVGANPLPLVIPCHRVVAADERLGGFSGGLHRKAALLELEGVRTRGSGPRARVAVG